MRGTIGRRFHPATALAVTAIFIALGTGAYAGSKIGSDDIAKNAVKSKHIKTKAVKSKHLKRNAVKSKHVKADTLTGSDINEATLGQVPNAANAASADSAKQAATAQTAATAETAKQVESVIPFYRRVAINETNFDVARLGPFRLFGDCSLSSGGQLAPNLEASTSENDAAGFAMDNNDITDSEPDFNVGEVLSLDSYQEAGEFQIIGASTARLLAASGPAFTIHATIASRVFSDNSSERTGCVFSGYAVRSG